MATVFQYSAASDFVVKSSMFGGNHLYNRNLLSGTTASYTQAADLLHMTGVRYPGGSITEEYFDVANPDTRPAALPASDVFVGVSEFLTWSATQNHAATIVLPTSHMLVGTMAAGSLDAPRAIDTAYLNKIKAYVTKLVTVGDTGPGALPDATIAAFEIGNEYWGSGAMTSREYGIVVNAMVAAIDSVLDTVLGASAPHPEIIVQMGGPWDAQFDAGGIYSSMTWLQRVQKSNQDIIAGITDPRSIASITGLVEHFYYDDTATTLTQSSASMNYINTDIGWWEAAGFTGRSLHLTEWNTKNNNLDALGLKGASILVAQMEYMLELGADSAFVWPIQHNTNSDLAGLHNTAPVLTPRGAAFALMAESLPGQTLLANGITSGPLEVDAYESDSRMVFFVSSRSDLAQTVALDLSSVVDAFASLSGTKIGVAAGASVTSNTDPAVITTLSAAALGNSSTATFTLQPYEILRLTYTLHASTSFAGTAGNDSILGGLGNDVLAGQGGNDSLTGNRGHDTISGNLGNDVLNGFGGNDKIYGGDGNDGVYGQQGYDDLWGGAGNDLMNGSIGDDTLHGDAGVDRLYGDAGLDTLTGGAGADTFYFNTAAATTNVDTITDMTAASDKIALDDLVYIGLATGALAAAAFASNTTGLAGDASDRIIYEKDSGDLWYDRDGTGTAYTRLQIAHLAANLTLTQVDFTVF